LSPRPERDASNTRKTVIQSASVILVSIAGLPEADAYESRNSDSGIPLVVCVFALFPPRGAVYFVQAALETGRAEIPIIALGSMGAVGGRPSFIVHI
jgi:hypothetical protein